ncbi:MAG: HEAT repeat domain-containing protein [Patescibacteria group bacterium]
MKRILIILLVSLTATACFAGASEREKMLLRYVLQDDFARDPGAKLSHTNSLETILTQHIKSTNALIRQQSVLSLGTTGWGSQLDPERAKQVLREVLKSETGNHNWVKLDAARVLAWFGDDAGKSVLADALYGRDGYMTQSGIEYRKAIVPLLLIDYDFSQGFPQGIMVWGGLQDYLNDEAAKRKPNQAPENTVRKLADPQR